MHPHVRPGAPPGHDWRKGRSVEEEKGMVNGACTRTGSGLGKWRKGRKKGKKSKKEK
jgi:hypothetical protein